MEEFPNIEEFDIVIIALNTLTQEIFDKIPDKLSTIREQMLTIFNTGRSIWCIMERIMTPSPPQTGPKSRPLFKGMVSPESTNYDWLFAHVSLREVVPSYTVRPVERMFEPYLQKVKKWDTEIENLYQLHRRSRS
jgi:hypothetical protein